MAFSGNLLTHKEICINIAYMRIFSRYALCFVLLLYIFAIIYFRFVRYAYCKRNGIVV